MKIKTHNSISIARSYRVSAKKKKYILEYFIDIRILDKLARELFKNKASRRYKRQKHAEKIYHSRWLLPLSTK